MYIHHDIDMHVLMHDQLMTCAPRPERSGAPYRAAYISLYIRTHAACVVLHCMDITDQIYVPVSSTAGPWRAVRDVRHPARTYLTLEKRRAICNRKHIQGPPAPAGSA